MSWWCSSHVISTLILALYVLWMPIFSHHRFFTVLQDLQMMMHYSFMFLLPFPHFLSFCHSLISQSQNLVSEYRSSFPVQSSASNGLLNGQSGSEGSKLLVDPFKDCCFSSCHTLLSIKFPSLLLCLYLSICIDNISSILLCCYLGHLCPWPTIHFSFSAIRDKEIESLFIQCHTSLTCRCIASICLRVVITSVSSFFWSSRCCHCIAL